MHLRAFYVFIFVILMAGDARSDGNINWYAGLRTVFKNCPLESWNNSRKDEFLETFRKCVQEHVLIALDTLLADDIIPIFEGLVLVRYQKDRMNSTNDKESNIDDNTNWTAIIMKRFLRVLHTHVFKIDVDRFTNNILSFINNSKTNVDNYKFEGRRRRHRRRHNHMVPLMMMGFLLMGSILIPMGFQFLAVLGGKALLLAKMALILSSIQGLKKIATNGVNYGLYHTPVAEGWHDRSHIEPSHLDLPFPPHIRP
ncbi:uncharacterized protein LOC122711492 [Apis laboriosa]|uniref:uncharacterized protein LOC122711492 n=1 Tax=Apis laboriosa TaxID=183418 RepID=UPI001CC77851|nr:uncharacterized protein LOC122711492 [Apis laboriosa]XP_043786242.1 uncharacterized protein LOC122711492 [Apis laboriosa]